MDERFDVLGVKVSVTNLAQACATIGGWIKTRNLQYVCVAPVSTIVDCQDDGEYRDIVNKAGLVTPDGMPLVWLGKFRGHKTIARTYGPDLMQALCDFSQPYGYKHFFYGGSEESNRGLVERLQRQFPKLQIAGRWVPGKLGLKPVETKEIIDLINDTRPDILWIGLGSPKQDFWMARHRSAITAPVMIGAGAAFDFLSGTKPQAPGWMQRSGLEWLFRLSCEPGRLWRRYLIGNTRFIYGLMTRRQGKMNGAQ